MTQPIPIRRARALRVLDTFSCSGGMAMGFHLAGYDVTGVDINPQPHYPFTFIQGDAIEYIRAHGHEYDLIHGSPPCQDYSNLNAYNQKAYPRLIAPTRAAMIATGRPYVIENVEIAGPELIDPITLCGPMFGLNVYRHRVFETNWPLTAPAHPKHVARCTRNGYLPTPQKPFMSIHGGRHSRAWQNAAADAMQMPWIKVPAGGDIPLGIREVCEAIPPAYSHWIGDQFLTLERTAVA
ncbi:SAM-dependent methyltransferase [[Kitasatospora] papulosa]|uniref:SAM-dependent methyltransferase n=1 Tax=[Kitasatospora] papulosa TaxID=1464011 RepID=UPI00386D00FE|nr:SAM-dependent methyltransferase [[Kitasatospora] papulosa]